MSARIQQANPLEHPAFVTHQPIHREHRYPQFSAYVRDLGSLPGSAPSWLFVSDHRCLPLHGKSDDPSVGPSPPWLGQLTELRRHLSCLGLNFVNRHVSRWMTIAPGAGRRALSCQLGDNLVRDQHPVLCDQRIHPLPERWEMLDRQPLIGAGDQRRGVERVATWSFTGHRSAGVLARLSGRVPRIARTG